MRHRSFKTVADACLFGQDEFSHNLALEQTARIFWRSMSNYTKIVGGS